MKSEFRIVWHREVFTAEFGKIKHLPSLEEDGQFAGDAVGYVKGENGARDAYLDLREGHQIQAGIEYPEFRDTKLRGGRYIAVGDEVCFIRHQQETTAACWGLTKFFDQAILTISERQQFRLLRETRRKVCDKLQPRGQLEHIAEGSVEMLRSRYQVLIPYFRDEVYTYYWQKLVDGTWTSCEDPRPIKTPVTEAVSTAVAHPENNGKVRTAQTTQTPSETPEPHGEVLAATKTQELTAEEMDDAEARRMLDALCPGKGMDISGHRRRSFCASQKNLR